MFYKLYQKIVNIVKAKRKATIRKSTDFSLKSEKKQLMVHSREGGGKHVRAVTCSESPLLCRIKQASPASNSCSAAPRIPRDIQNFLPVFNLRLKRLAEESELIKSKQHFTKESFKFRPMATSPNVDRSPDGAAG